MGGGSAVTLPPSTPASYKIGQAQNYTVVAGDTVDSVAQQFNMPVETLIGANHLVYPYALQTGQVLFIPGRGGALGAGGSYTVVPGDTLTRIARRNGTTVPVLAQLNGLTAPYVIKVGQHLKLPGAAPMETAAAAAPGAAGGEMIQFPPASPAPPLPAVPSGKVAAENLVPLSSTSTTAAPTVAPSSASQTATVQAQPAAPSPNPDTTSTSSSQESATAGSLAAVPLPSTKPGAGTAPAAPTTTANAATPPSPDTTAAANSASTAAAPATQPAPTPENVTPPPRGSGKFLWPVNGKLVSLFGVKEGGQHNDGINIAAPLGTPVHAADNGVVAYAGNELRGFGNLLLIRHADGWVSAYAHCDALLVKRGDQVKRGQVIARVGQTGAVSSPQLHFELRKAGTAVDPTNELGPQGA
jgi:murein DD-endopeptidase MepM/ murein hydrolase activator NlpD